MSRILFIYFLYIFMYYLFISPLLSLAFTLVCSWVMQINYVQYTNCKLCKIGIDYVTEDLEAIEYSRLL